DVGVQGGAPVAEHLLGLLQALEVLGGAAGGGQGGDGGLQRQADGGQVLEVVVGAGQQALVADGDGPAGGGLDAGAGAVDAADQPQAGQPAQRLADDAAADAHAGTDLA